MCVEQIGTGITRPPQNLEILAAVADAGAALVAVGAEMWRAEDTMERLAKAYGAGEVQAVVLPTALLLYGSSGHSEVRRIRRRAVNLASLEAINQLSRDVAQACPPVSEFSRRLAEIRDIRRYPSWASMVFAAIGAGGLSQFMGGTLEDFLPAMVAGALTQWVHQRLRASRFRFPGSLVDMLAAVTAVLPALAVAYFSGPGWPFHSGTILVAGIMVLVPGVAMTTAIQDAINGDSLAAGARFLEALLTAGAVAAGAGMALYIYLNAGGRWP